MISKELIIEYFANQPPSANLSIDRYVKYFDGRVTSIRSGCYAVMKNTSTGCRSR